MIIKIDPVPAPRMTRSDKWANRPCVARYFAFRNKLFAEYGQFLPIPTKLVFTIRMPDSWNAKKKAAMNGKPHCQKPDVDNLLKGTIDGLLKEDSHVWRVDASKYWGYEGSIEIDAL